MTDAALVLAGGGNLNPATANAVQKEMWVCDVCKVKKFEDFDEACRHEESCALEQEKAKTAKPTASYDSNADDVPTTRSNRKRQSQAQAAETSKNIPSIFQKKTKREKQQAGETSKSTTSNRITKGKVLQDVKSNGNKNQKGMLAFVRSQASSSSEKSEMASTKMVSSSPKGNKKRRSPSNENNPDKKSVQLVELAHPADQQKPPKKAKTKGKAAKRTKAIVKSTSNAATLAAIFQNSNKEKAEDGKALMSEQVAAELQSQRRLERECQRERERERQRKRQETFFQRKPANKTCGMPCDKKKSSKFSSCPRFPVPSFSPAPAPRINSHTSIPTEKNNVWASEDDLQKARLVVQKSLPFPSRPSLQFADHKASSWELCRTALDDGIQKHPALCTPSIQTELAKILNVIPRESASSNHEKQTHGCDLDVSDICGETNLSVAKHLGAFVREWMVERQKSHQRMAERQKALLKKHKTSNRKKRTTRDEDLWTDSEDDDNALPSICLIEGPVGSCKSALIHAVARQCECPVVELNTSDKRGGAHLRKVLEETTLSHSSLEMLKKQEANIFFRNNLGSDDSDDEQEIQQSGSKLTVILIDEVDNIYESDIGFWSSLYDLTKRARCPVFLTANSLPRGLSSSPSLRFRHFITSRPSPSECAKKIEQLVHRGGFTRQKSETNIQAFASVAEQCGCDLRRIKQELQLFLCTKQSTDNVAANKCNGNPIPCVALAEPHHEAKKSDKTVYIESITPKTVASDDCTLITIKGKNFRKSCDASSIAVFAGGQECYGARLVDEETILAVVQPRLRPHGVDRFGIRVASSGFIEVERPSLNALFVPISLRSGQSKARLTNISSSAMNVPLIDDSNISVMKACNIEYSFPASDDAPSDEEEIIEFNDARDSSRSTWLSCRASCLKQERSLRSLSSQTQEEAMKTADELVATEIKKMSENRDTAVVEPLVADQSAACQRDKDEQHVLELMAREYELASDASLLDCYVGVPLSSGASPGFGYDFTPEGSRSGGMLSQHGNATHCSAEKLFALGWKDSCAFYGDQESFMFHPRGRDLQLVNFAHMGIRGQAQSMEQEANAPDEKDLEANNTEKADLTLWEPLDSRLSSEDFCLDRPIPTSLASLPSMLLSARKYLTPPYLKHDVLFGRLAQMSDSGREMMGVLYSEDQAKVHVCGSSADSVLHMDYLPTLRNMAAYEQAASSVADTEATGSRRRTRKSRRGRIHYFESLNQCYGWDNEFAFSATGLGQRLADARLHFRPIAG